VSPTEPSPSTPAVAPPAVGGRRVLRAADGVPLVWRVRRGPHADGAPLLLIHGLASNGSRFAEFCDETTLAARHALIRVDLRGHGDATTRRRIGTDLWCRDLAAVLDAETGGARAAPAFVVGHSLGAQVALHFALREPARAQGLVLIDPVFRTALHGRWLRYAQAAPLFRAAAGALRALNALGLHRRRLAPLDLRALDVLARRALADPAAEQAFIDQYSSFAADLKHVPLAVYLQDLVEMFAPAPRPRELACPVLALLSSGATFADAAVMRAELAGPRTTIEAIDCHHWPLTERPREVREAIERWVQAQAPPGR
jgi:pimeloyl-ACP methyl ester carboxylesterase